MKTAIVKSKSQLKSVEVYEGETIETKVSRIINEKAPIEDGAPIIFTDRSEGVLPAYDIRTDRWDIATDAMDKVNKAKIARSGNVSESTNEQYTSRKQSNKIKQSTSGCYYGQSNARLAKCSTAME